MKKQAAKTSQPKRKRRRKIRKGPGIFLRLLTALLICAAIVMAVTVFFKVKQVLVEGESRYSAEELKTIANIKTDENLFFVNKHAVTAKLFQNHPFLDEIRIERKLPDTIIIHVKDCTPAAALVRPDGVYLMDKKGKMLEKTTAEAAAGICSISGIEPKNTKVGDYVEFSDEEKGKALFSILNTANNSGILKEIVAIDMEKIYEITLKYGQRFTVELGTVEDLDKKFQFLQKVIEQLGESDTGVIDLTDTRTARFRPE